MLHFPHCVRLWLYSELTLQNILPGGWLGSQDAGWRLYTFWKTCKRCTAKMVPFTKLGPVFPHIMETCFCSLLVWEEEQHILEKLQNQASHWDMLIWKTLFFKLPNGLGYWEWAPRFQSFRRMPMCQFRQPCLVDQEICSGLLLYLSNCHRRDGGRMSDPSPARPAWRIQRGLSSPKVVQHLERCFPRLGEVAWGHTRKWRLGRSCSVTPLVPSGP